MSDVVDGEAVEEGEFLPAVRVDASPALLLGGATPGQVVEHAQEVAKALADVVDQRNLYKMIGGKKHVLVDGWALLGSLVGVFPVVEWSRQTADGWEARVVAQTLSGAEVGAAEAMCSRREARWKNADDYAVRSMAQTRATSKALRLPLGFIMQLAGYEPTPEAEIPAEPEAKQPQPERGRLRQDGETPKDWGQLSMAYERSFYPHPWHEWWIEVVQRHYDVKLTGENMTFGEAVRQLRAQKGDEAAAGLWAGCLAAWELIPVSDLGPDRAVVREGFAKAFEGVVLQGPLVSMSPEEASFFPTFEMYRNGDLRPAAVAAQEAEEPPAEPTPADNPAELDEQGFPAGY